MHLEEEQLYEYLDEELAPEIRLQTEEHLSECGQCSQQLNHIRAFYLDLEGVTDIPLGRDLTPAVMASIKTGAGLTPALRWAAVFQIGAAILILAFTIPAVLQLPIVSQLAETVPAFQAEWQLLVESAGLQISQFIENLNPSPGLTLPFSYLAVIPVVLLAGVLWLVGNTILLGRTWQQYSGRQHKPSRI